MDEKKITRVEVIEDGQRKYVKWDCNIILSLQDNERTLKIFVNEEKTGECLKDKEMKK